MATTAADDLGVLNQLLAAAGLPATALTAGSTVAEYRTALDAAFGAAKPVMDANIQAATEYDTIYYTTLAAPLHAQENQAIAQYQAAVASLASADPAASLSGALDSAPAAAPVPPPAPPAHGGDTAILAGARADYTVARNADGTVTVSAAGGGGTGTVYNVERLQFSDGTLALDTGAGQVAGEAYRIYQAAFARTPDSGGLKFWIGVMDKGASLADIASGFMGSPEFQQAYGTNPTNADLVTRFYQNVLGRQPEQAGFDFWVGALDHGAARSDVLAAFAESAENQQHVNLVGGIQAGIFLA